MLGIKIKRGKGVERRGGGERAVLPAEVTLVQSLNKVTGHAKWSGSGLKCKAPERC